jgi:DHA1 family multidrug resistance protein-like MFS transporter
MESWKRNFLLVWLNNFVTAAGMMAFLPLFPLYLRQLGVTDESSVRIWSGVLVAGAPLTAAFMGPVWGALGDRIGRKPMMVRANLAIVVFVGAMSLVGSPLQLLALRLAQGLFSGFMAPSMTLVSVATPPGRQGRVSGLLHTAVIAGGLVGPVLGGFLADRIEFRWVFVVCALLSIVAASIVALWVREAPRVRPASADTSGLETLSLMRTVLRDVAVFLAPGPLRALLVAVFAVRIGAALIDPILVLHIERLDGYHPELLATTTGLVFGATAAATLVLTPVLGRIGDRRGHAGMLAICAAGGGLAYAAQGVATSVSWLYVLRFLSGAALAGVLPAAYAIAARASSAERRGGALGVTFSSLVLANAIGPAGGGLLAALIGLRPLFFVAAALMLAAAARMAFRPAGETHGPGAAQPSQRSKLAPDSSCSK